MSASAYQVAGLLDKLKHADSDLRFMALSDLSNELSKEGAPFDEVTERKFVAAVVKALDDTNGEVQNLAVKILAPLVRKGRDATVLEVVDRLCDLLVHKKDDLRDIGAIGMKTVVAQVPANSNAATNMVKRLVPKLIALLMNPTAVHFDTIDILSEITVRFGSMLAEHSADPSNQSSFTRQIQDALFPYLSNPRPAIRKRTVAAFGNLVVHESDELFDALMHKTVTEMKEKEGAEDYDRLKTFVGLIGTLARFSARRVGNYVDTLLPLLIAYVAFDNDELREACFQTFESFIVRCPTEISAHIPEITKVSLEYLKHDPNYDDGEDNDDDEDEEMEQDADADDEMDEDADEEGDDDEEGYSDDEDMSWKVRRASAKTLSSIISTRTELIESFFDNVAPTLVKRFKEREESVRVEILATFITLIRQVGALHGVSGGAGNAAAKKAVRGIQVTTLLQNLVGKLSKTLSKELNGKSVPTRQSGFILLRELAVVLEGGLQDTFGQFVASIEASLATSTTEAAKKHGKGPKPINNLNLKIEVLDFLKVALPLHHPSIFSPYLQNLVPPIVAAISGKFFKVTSEALVVSVELVKVIRPFSSNHLDDAMVVEEVPSTPASPKTTEYIQSLYKTVFARVNVADLDVEVKERAILALVTLLAQTVDLTGVSAQEVQSTVLPLLIERLRNELTRLTTVKGFKTLCESPFCGSQAGALLDLQSVLETSLVAELCSFLKKANRGLKVASLGTLTSVFTKYGSTVSEQTTLLVLQETPAVFADTDMNVFPLAVDLLAVIVDARGSSSAVLAAAKDATVAGKIVQVIMEGPHLVGYGTAGLDALVAFWRVLVVKGGVAFFDEMVALLTAAAETKGLAKSAFRPIAQSLAALIVEAKAFSKLSEYVAKVQDAAAHENASYLALNVIGEVGRSIDLSANHPTLQDSLLALFNSPSEEIKHAAAFALGNVALGNLSIYMPLLIKASKEGGKRRYLILVALKEVIARSSSTSNHSKPHVDSPLKPYSKDLWTLLFSSTEQAKEEGTRTVIAECLGKLAVQDPALYLPELVSGVSSESSAVRSTVVLAIRYTFTDASGAGAALHASVVAFDEALSQVIVQFLRLLTDADLSVRHIALATLNSAAHNKPYLIIDTLPELLPLLYQETMIREDLIRTVVMGPFKHKVDEGLDARKSAFECMYTLLERCLSKIEIFAFLDRVAAGLSDPAQEIRMLNHTMLQRLVATSPAALASRLDTMVAPLKEALATVPKTNAVKQEIEKVNELVRSSVRAVLVVGRVLLGLSGGGSGAAGVEASVGGGSCPAFDEFYRMVKAPGYALAEVVGSVGVEVDAQPLVRGKNQMDLS
ncbi:armadillo-type protein [Chytriomyces cf. hyalinus JEL632]|nr:armadillo-type protein [Chytriomyces cf. hyalinus JEL632]